jgi:hypothetical protein
MFNEKHIKWNTTHISVASNSVTYPYCLEINYIQVETTSNKISFFLMCFTVQGFSNFVILILLSPPTLIKVVEDWEGDSNTFNTVGV